MPACRTHNRLYTEFLYRRQQRQGMLFRDCQRLVNQGRNVFAACMVAQGDADAMVTGLTRTFPPCCEDVARVIDRASRPAALRPHDDAGRGPHRVHRRHHGARAARPRRAGRHRDPGRAQGRAHGLHAARRAAVVLQFRQPAGPEAERIRDAVALLDRRQVDFEYDGEMAADVALDPELMALYPFCRLTGPANVLIMPALHSANIAAKLLQQLGGGPVIGPLLIGLSKPVQIVPMNATVSDIVNLAALAAHELCFSGDIGKPSAQCGGGLLPFHINVL